MSRQHNRKAATRTVCKAKEQQQRCVLQGLVVYETVLEPGQILFIPEGWAHQAINLEWTAMVSSNYFDTNSAPNVLSLMNYQHVRCPAYRICTFE